MCRRSFRPLFRNKIFFIFLILHKKCKMLFTSWCHLKNETFRQIFQQKKKEKKIKCCNVCSISYLDKSECELNYKCVLVSCYLQVKSNIKQQATRAKHLVDLERPVHITVNILKGLMNYEKGEKGKLEGMNFWVSSKCSSS